MTNSLLTGLNGNVTLSPANRAINFVLADAKALW